MLLAVKVCTLLVFGLQISFRFAETGSLMQPLPGLVLC